VMGSAAMAVPPPIASTPTRCVTTSNVAMM
jgi:hypothetical protein